MAVINYEELLNRADQFLKEDNKDEAFNLYKEAGDFFKFNGQTDRAIEIYKKILEFKEDIETLFIIAGIYNNRADKEASVEFYRRILRIEANHSEALREFAYINFDIGKFDVAIIALRKLIKLEPDNIDVLDKIGFISESMGSLRGATANYVEAASYAKDKKLYDKAYELLNKVLKLKPSHKEAQKEILLIKELEEAEKNRKEAGLEEEQSVEEVKIEEAVTAEEKSEELPLEEVKAEEAVTAEEKSEELPLEEVKAEEAVMAEEKSEELPLEEVKAEEAVMAEEKSEELPLEEVKAEEAVMAEEKSEELPLEEVKAEEAVMAEEKSEELPLEEVKAEEAVMAEEKSEELPLEEVKAEEAVMAEEKSEELPLEEVKAEEAVMAEEKSEELPLEEVKAEEAVMAEEKSEELPLEEVKPEEAVMAEEKSEELPLEEVKPEEAVMAEEKSEELPLEEVKPEEAVMAEEKSEELPLEEVKPEEAVMAEEKSEEESVEEVKIEEEPVEEEVKPEEIILTEAEEEKQMEEEFQKQQEEELRKSHEEAFRIAEEEQKQKEEEKTDEDDMVEIIEVVDGEWEDEQEDTADEEWDDEQEEVVEIIEVIEDDEVGKDSFYNKKDRIYLKLIDELLAKDFTSIIMVVQLNRAKLDERFFEVFDHKMESAAEHDAKLANDLSYLSRIMDNLRVRDMPSPCYEPQPGELEEESAEEEAQEEPVQEEPVKEEAPEEPVKEEASEDEEEVLETPFTDKYEKDLQYLFLIHRLIKSQNNDEQIILLNKYRDLFSEDFFMVFDELFYFNKNFNRIKIVSDLLYLNKLFVNLDFRKEFILPNIYEIKELHIPSPEEQAEEIKEEELPLEDKQYMTEEVSLEEEVPADVKENITSFKEEINISPVEEKEPEKSETEKTGEAIKPEENIVEQEETRLDFITREFLSGKTVIEQIHSNFYDDYVVLKEKMKIFMDTIHRKEEHDYLSFKDAYRKKIKIKQKAQVISPEKYKEIFELPVLEKSFVDKVFEEKGQISSEDVMAETQEEKEEIDYRGLFEEYLISAIGKDFTNLHLIIGQPPLMRLFGELEALKLPPVTTEFTYALVNILLDENQLRSFLYNKNLEILYEFFNGNILYRCKINFYEHLDGWNVNIYFIHPFVPSLDKLNLPDIINSFAFINSGLVVISGPARSGKTTTLNGILNFINENRAAHIITIENSIEYVHESINSLVRQRQIGFHCETGKSAVDFAIRENPDVIFISEINDGDILYSALLAAESGKLVFTTLPAPDSITAITNILEYFPGDKQHQIREMLVNSLKYVVTQHLLPVRDKEGFIPAVEVLAACKKLSELIIENNLGDITTLIESSSEPGMNSLEASIISLYEDKIISKETALNFVEDLK